MIQLRGFLGRLLGPLLKTGLSLKGNLLKPLAKKVLVPSGLTAALSATDAAIYKKILRSGITTFIFSKEDFNDIVKIVKSFEESGLPIKDVSETLKKEVKEQKGGFLGMLEAALASSLLRNMISGKGVITAGKGTIRAGQDF